MGFPDLRNNVNLAKQGIRDVCDAIAAAHSFPDTIFSRLVVFFVSKSVTSLYAVEELWKVGYGVDAQVLVRTILEDAINFYYINGSPQSRSEEFVNYGHVEVYRELQALKRTSKTTGISAQREAEIVADYEAHKATYKGRPNWSGKTLDTMAGECGLTMHYHTVYRYASSFAHGGPLSVMSFLEMSGDRLVFNVAVPNPQLSEIAVNAACNLTLMIADLACSVFSLKEPPSFVEARDRFWRGGL